MRRAVFALLAALMLAPASARPGALPGECVQPPASLLSAWPGEGSADDAEGTHHGVLQNGATFAAGFAGQGFFFDGVDDFITVADDPGFTPADLTISAWVSSPGVTNAFAGFIVARSGPDGLSGYEVGVNPPALGETLRFVMNGGTGGADLSGTSDVADGAFHHVVAAADATGMRIYVDGVLEASNTVGLPVNYPAGFDFVIGRRESLPNVVPEVWNGVIDELHFFSGEALCEAEIAAIAAAGDAGFCDGGLVPVCPECGNGIVEAPESCDDGNTAAGDGCDAQCAIEPGATPCPLAPAAGCLAAAKASLTIVEKNPGSEKLKAQLKSFDGPSAQGDLGDPVSGATRYDLCLYDDADRRVATLGVDRAGQSCGPKQKPCWKDKGGKGWTYKDPDAAASGVKTIAAVGGPLGKGKLALRAGNKARRGQTTLPTGTTAALQGAALATLQVLTSDGVCLTATLATVKKSEAELFKAKVP